MTDIYETLTDDQKEILDKVDPNSVLLQLEGVREILSTFQDRIDINGDDIGSAYCMCLHILETNSKKLENMFEKFGYA